MEIKKTSNADLERIRPKAFFLGLVVTVVTFVAAIEISFDEASTEFDSDFLDEIAEEMEYMPPIEESMPQQVEVPTTPADHVEVVEQAETLTDGEETAEEQKVDPIAESEVEDEPTQEVDEQPTMPEEEPVVPMGAVEQLPQFPGGMSQLMKWLTAQLKYPESAKAAKVSGRVLVAFIVEKDGTVGHVELLKGVHDALDSEALRVVKMMPNWQPGMAGGKPCRTLVHMPVVYKL